MTARARPGSSAAGDAAYDLLINLGFPLPVDVDAVRTHLGLELRREATMPARIRGLLLVPERLIVVREGLAPRAEEHVVLHECGHHRMAEHRALVFRCSAFDLDAGVRRRMEAEANAFASVMRFGSVPDGWVDAESPSIARVRALADLAGASFESALRWFVGQSRRPVWALVCGARPSSGGRSATAYGVASELGVRYGYRSPAARPVPWPTVLPTECLRRGAGEGVGAWPWELSGYRLAGAGGWEAHATPYWTCVLVW